MINAVKIANINTIRNNNTQSQNNKSEFHQSTIARKNMGIPKNLHPIYFTGWKIPKNLPKELEDILPNKVEKFIDYDQIRGTIPKVLDKTQEANRRAFFKSHKNQGDFSHRSIKKEDFSKSSFYECDFSNSNLKGTNFQHINAFSSKFNGAELGKFEGKNTDFYCADLASCEFKNVKIDSKVDMQKANIMSADFSGTDGDYLNLTNAIYDDLTILPRGIDPEEEQMIKITKGADLSKKGLEKYGDMNTSVTLDNVKLRQHTSFKNVDFTETSAKRSDFKSSKFFNCTMDKMDLTRSYLREVKMKDVDMISAKLKQANFHRAELENVDMSGADLRGALLTWNKEATKNITLKGATYDDLTQFHDDFNPEEHGMKKAKLNWASYGISDDVIRKLENDYK